jgi:hypothetical protein
MAEQPNQDQAVFDKTLADELAKGTDRRVAEGRAKSAAVRAYRKAHPEEDHGSTPAAGSAVPAATPAGSAVPAASAPAAAPVAAAPAATAVATAAPAVPRVAPPPTGKPPSPKQGAPDKHRLLALVAPEGIQAVERDQGDRVNTAPHLLVEELVALLVLLALLVIYSTLVNAPLRELANPNLTPNPSKAPWYFLGLQELLKMFNPAVAGVLIPGIALGLLAITPYIDRNPSHKPNDRKFAITMMSMFLMMWAVLVIIGCFFRGPGFNFIFPWDKQGIFFEL